VKAASPAHAPAVQNLSDDGCESQRLASFARSGGFAGRPGSPPAPDYVGRTCALISALGQNRTPAGSSTVIRMTRLLKSPHGRFGNEGTEA